MITIDNYEEYFLDYCEGNLDAEGRREVMSFVKAHPYLREELEEFAGCPVLDDETDMAVETPANLADSLRHTSDYDEPDVPYFDRLAVLNLEKIATPAEQLEYSRMKYESIECNRVAKLYSKTILPAEQIECPDKRRMMVFPIWRRLIPYAAAAAVVGLIVWFSIGNNAAVSITSPAAPSVAVENLRPAAEVVAPASEVTTPAAIVDAPRREKKSEAPVSHDTDPVENVNFDDVQVVMDNHADIREDSSAIVQLVNVEPIFVQEDSSAVVVEMLPFDDLDDGFDNGFNDKKSKKHHHRKKFWFACGKALKYVARRFVPNVHFDVVHDEDGKISRVAMYAQNKIYTLERKESKDGREL